jgi:hypothetical protein
MLCAVTDDKMRGRDSVISSDDERKAIEIIMAHCLGLPPLLSLMQEGERGRRVIVKVLFGPEDYRRQGCTHNEM